MVDGHSRLIIWIKVNNSNRAQTTCDAFKDVVENAMKPSQLRSDCGTKNQVIAKHITLSRDKEPCKGCVGGKRKNGRTSSL